MTSLRFLLFTVAIVLGLLALSSIGAYEENKVRGRSHPFLGYFGVVLLGLALVCAYNAGGL